MESVKKYSFDFFTNLSFIDHDYQLPISTLEIIKELEKKVGSPNYVKTPIFKKRENNDEWSTIRSFKTTKISDINTDYDKLFSAVKDILNKITCDNYNTMKDKLLLEMRSYNINEENMSKICKSIFSIATNNKFYSKVYAQLYKVLIETYEDFKNIYSTSFEEFIKIFDNIEFINSEDDYDEYCRVNKLNEMRKALTIFFVNLMKLDVISENKIIHLIIKLQNLVNNYQEMQEKRNVNVYIADILYLFIVEGKENIKNNKNFYDVIKYNIKQIVEIDTKVNKGITNKMIFKYMDILDKMNWK
uniref:MIF4G domain-containing protein n=1 Tax=viral metagenome TaxID=1070528 RepID=A0A6C0KG52_9ZZZZ